MVHLVQSYPVLPSSAVDRATDQLIAVAAVVDAAALREAEDLALRLTPDLWPLEWHLPFWLGCDFGLTEAAWQQPRETAARKATQDTSRKN